MRTIVLAVVLAAPGRPIAAQSPFDLTRLTTGEQAFELRAGGRAAGTLTASLTMSGGEWTYVEKTVIPGRTEQTTRVRMSGAGELVAVSQNGTTPAGATSIDVRYAAGRAKGTATVPTPSGVRTVSIDTAIQRFAIDDNLLQALLPALPLRAGARVAVQIFKSGQGTATEMTLMVSGEEKIEVPLGTFNTWKVTAQGTPNVSFYVAQKAPYQLLRMTVDGSPLEMVRIK